MDSATNYIAMDRQQAMARGVSLPGRSHGAALFADISGFTPLAEGLVRTLGVQRGAEELSRQLNLVFDALIDQVNRYRGSVIVFSGDALTCWFDVDDGGRATAAAFAMQNAMTPFATMPLPRGGTVSLAMKTAVAVGPVRRFAVGDPSIQLIDVLAGNTLEQLAAAEHHARSREVVLDPVAARALGDKLDILEWRDEAAARENRFAVVGHLNVEVPATPWPSLDPDSLSEEQVRSWVLSSVYSRVRSGQGTFLAELRPAVALFLHFGDLDYDNDEDAPAKLDAFVRWVQSVVARYDGSVLQLSIGDKGSYLQMTFGAPIAHDDDAARAVSAALELRRRPAELSYIGDVQIGISTGRTRAGPYGGTTRRTYGVLGDEVNLAARLMQHAASGQVLVSQRIADATRHLFTWEALPAIHVKGKSDLIQVFTPAPSGAQRRLLALESSHMLPLVGRESEMALIGQEIDRVQQGQGRIIAITGEAGMGKTRLVAEVVRLARARGFEVYSGECQSYGANSAYLVWHDIWRAFFGLDEREAASHQVWKLESELARMEPTFVLRMPLLGVALNLLIPDNDLTASLDPKLRKSSLETLLVDCLKARILQRPNQTSPLLFVLEDCHWLDPLSYDLLEALSHVLSNLPVLILLAYRTAYSDSPDSGHAPRVVKLPYCTEICLGDFTATEAARLIEIKLAQLHGGHSHGAGAPTNGVPPAVIERISRRAQGNPFYIEELLNYLHAQGADLRHDWMLDQMAWPDSLHSLILSRIDQLSESQRITLKVASIIGRLFPFKWLWGVYPALGALERVVADIEVLQELDLTPLESLEPEERYMFKHIITQEVAYESQPYATRAEFHEQLARFIEATYADTLDQYLDLLAYHYGQSNNVAKQKEYYRKAGAAAEAAYAPEAAIGYYQKALALVSTSEPSKVADRLDVYEGLGRMLTIRARYAEAIETFKTMSSVADRAGDVLAQAKAWYSLANAYSQQGDHRAALDSATRAEAAAQYAGDHVQLAIALEIKGRSLFRLGDSEAALALAERIIAITDKMGERRQLARGRNLLGAIHNILGHYRRAEEAFAKALVVAEEIRDRQQMMTVLNNLGVIASARGDYQTAINRYEEVLKVARAIGHRSSEMVVLSNLGASQVRFGEYEEAATNLHRAIAMAQEAGSDASADTYNFLAEAYLGLSRTDEALDAARHALQLAQTVGEQRQFGAAWRALGLVAARLAQPVLVADKQTGQAQSLDARACFAESVRIFSERRMEGERARTLKAWARYELERGDQARGLAMWQEAREVFARLGAEFEAARMARSPLDQTA